MERPGSKTNGQHSSNSSRGQPSSDLYKQLINNDMVKELDDIEAISQQIFQHAEVLHNSWKNNGMTQGPQFKLSAAQQVSPDHSNTNSLSLGLRERGGYHQSQTNGAANSNTTTKQSPSGSSTGSLKQPSHYTRQAGYSDTGLRSDDNHSYNSWPSQTRQYHTLPDTSPRHSQSSSVSSPTSSTRESPARGSSVTHINNDAGPLELLASPNLNGNLEDLVSSFVNTDRAKQAARNTISSTLMRRLGSPNGSASPVRSPSPQPTSPTSSSSSYFSPLRSPMLTSSAPTRQSEAMSPPPAMFPSDNNDVHSPMQSIFSSRSPSTSTQSSGSFKSSPGSPGYSQTLPKANLSHRGSDIHSQMQSMFSPKTSSANNHFNNFNSGASSKTSPLHINTEKDSTDGSIPIPVKHIPIARADRAPSSNSDSLKSPSVLQNANKNTFPSSAATNNSDQQHAPMPNLFDEYGSVNDARFLEMRRRFEEAKQRMALSLPAREGGVRPNSFGALGRGMFDSPWGDDPSMFLLEQFRRRNKRRMEMPSAPHPELTPEQKQHISDRTSTMLQTGAPLRRSYTGSRPGGSVAERVLMFEKSPSAFGVEPVQVKVPQRREPMLQGTVITPWKSSLHDSANKLQVIYIYLCCEY